MEKLFSLIKYLGSRLFYPIFSTIALIALLCIPGNALPGLGLFGIKHIDKLIHFILFGGLVLLWGIYVWQTKATYIGWIWTLGLVTILSIVLGIIMEFIQAAFIPQRSFDIGDIWADLIGSLFFAFLLARKGRPWKLLE